MSGIVGGINLRSSGLVNLGSASDGTVFTGTGAGLPVGFEAAAGGGAWTLISSVEISDAVTTTITGLTSSAYETWAISLSDIKTETNGAGSIRLQIGDSGGLETGADYNFGSGKWSADATGWYSVAQMAGTVGYQICSSIGGNEYGFGGMYYIHNPSTSDTRPMISGTGVFVMSTDSGRATAAFLAGTFSSNITLDRIALVGLGGSPDDKIYSGRMTVWGIKHT
jgi:hypothetical protein